MRRSAWLLAVIAMLLVGVASCASPQRTIPAPRAGAPLRVGTSGDYPPFSVCAPDDSCDGLDVAVARAFAKDRGRDVVLVRFTWPELERRLVAGDFDVAMSGVTVRGDRLAIAPMTATVTRTSAVLVVPASRAAPVPSDGAGLTVAVNRGGHLERVARSRLPKARLKVTDDNRSLPALLASGTVDGVVTDDLEAESFPAAGAGATRVALVLSEDRKAYWVAPGNDALADDLDAWLAARAADGSLAPLRARFIGTAARPDRGLPAATAYVVDLVARRLLLMPEVAAAKLTAGLPIEVPAREADVVERARSAGVEVGLAEGPYVAFVRAQMEVAKAVQRAVVAGRTDAARSADEAAVVAAKARLDGQLRPAIDRLDAQIRAALAAGAPLSGTAAAVAGALQADAPVPGLDADQARLLAEALLALPAREVRRA